MKQRLRQSGDIQDYLFSIAFDVMHQLRSRFESSGWTQARLARELGVSEGRISQILNTGSGMTLKQMVRCARALGLKICVLAYDDGDTANRFGPIHPSIFQLCWENCGKPLDMDQAARATAVACTDTVLPRLKVVNNIVTFGQDTARKDDSDAGVVSTDLQLQRVSGDTCKVV